ncbi:sensor histidine kinase [Roseateles oligotrophus]|uniref:histidine kinase n=1 Tax=Roseateles oligotrophus TaxID=1769250 RepID=A0ABT2YJ11_9BURK|nr:histidine kinase dimerization/phosphoacceptor domain -containing protein [Roseateles oligotrophus]MCV2369987.1 response regulator [Roseateles oligotrophus]
MLEQELIPLLLVDDRPENLRSLQGLLDSPELQLQSALSGQEALRLALRTDFALILMDVQMPEMDGFETAELLRSMAKTRRQPIIFVTAAGQTEHIQFRGYDAGAVDVLLKPIDPNILISKVRVFVELYRQRRQIERQEEHLQQEVEQRTQQLQLTTERLQTTLQEREILLREIYHRVKNNLQAVSGLLSLQAHGCTDELARSMLQSSGDRVRSIAMVHEQLYQSDNLARIDLRRYLAQLTEHLMQAYQPASDLVPIHLSIDALELGIEKAVPLGLLVNELLINAYKHGFAPQAAGRILVQLRLSSDGDAELTVEDVGIGFAPGFELAQQTGLGMQLVASLARQLQGRLSIESAQPGARIVLKFLS